MAKRATLILACAALVVFGPVAAQKPKASPVAKTWAAEPSTFFGIPLGGQIKQTDVANCGMSSAMANPDITVCALGGNEKVITIAGFPIKELESGYIGLVGDAVSMVKARGPHANYQKMRALLVERYGPASSTKTGVVQNGMGATFSNEELTWNGVNVTLTLRERDGKVDQTGITIYHHKTVDQAMEADGQKRRSEAAKF